MNNQEVCVVIISYDSPENVVACVNSAISQVDKIVVIDNSPDSASGNVFKSVIASDRISFTYNETNKGLGCALNQGIRYSLANGFEWTLLLDQDSLLSDTMVSEMLTSYNNLPGDTGKEVAIVIPKVYDLNFRKILPPILTTRCVNKKIKKPNRDTFVHFQITSGMLIRNKVFEDVGMMNEYFFIDYIDFDYCFRVLDKGYKILLSKNALLYHRLAEKKKMLFFSFREHQPLRVYYQTRNRLFTLFEYGKNYRSFLYSESLRLVCKFLKILLLESNKKEKIRMYFHGVKDFVSHSRRFGTKTSNASMP